MNTDTIFQLIQQSFRVGVGATVSLLETLQDPKKRADILSTLQSQLSHQTQEWAEKGEVTEKEARRMVDQWVTQQSTPSTPGKSSTSLSTQNRGNIEAEIQQLTQQVMALRQELETERQKDRS